LSASKYIRNYFWLLVRFQYTNCSPVCSSRSWQWPLNTRQITVCKVKRKFEILI